MRRVIYLIRDLSAEKEWVSPAHVHKSQAVGTAFVKG